MLFWDQVFKRIWYPHLLVVKSIKALEQKIWSTVRCFSPQVDIMFWCLFSDIFCSGTVRRLFIKIKIKEEKKKKQKVCSALKCNTMWWRCSLVGNIKVKRRFKEKRLKSFYSDVEILNNTENIGGYWAVSSHTLSKKRAWFQKILQRTNVLHTCGWTGA